MRRRALLGAGLMAGAAGAWTSLSSSWSARFVRDRLSEWGREVPPSAQRPTPATWNDNAITLAWLGHATVLVNFYGLRLITDPVLFSRIGVDLGIGSLGPLRLVQCALSPDQLPDIDLVLVSHAHFDHLDTPSLGAIRGTPAIVMAVGTSDLVPSGTYRSVHELRWDEYTKVVTGRGDAVVRSIEVNHWGARLGRDVHRGYTGFIVEREGRRLLIGGDTAQSDAFRSHRRYGPFEAAVMPIGAYDPWIRYHCTPEQAVTMADAAGARLLVPVHHQSFALSREPFREPIERAERALSSERGRLALQDIGQTAIIVG